MSDASESIQSVLCVCDFERFLPVRRCAGTICCDQCMSVTSQCSIEMAERIELVVGTEASLD